MPLTLPSVRVGEPLRFEALSVFPLFTPGHGVVDYLLSDEALDADLITVEEVSEEGSVPDLLVENRGDQRVLFLEGEELMGAKQNRILNTSILVAAHSKLQVPVSCVEAGRWGYKTRTFSSGGKHLPWKLCAVLKRSVLQSLSAKQGYRSDQGEIWSQVAEYGSTHGVRSATAAMSDTFEALEVRAAAARELLHYVEGATGVAVALGKKVVAMELFDKPATCRKVWERLLSGYIIDALAEDQSDEAESVDVEELLGATSSGTWEEFPAVGEGEEYRASVCDDHASALCLHDTLVHGSVVAV